MGGKGGDPKMPVSDYYMSIHFGVCQGPVDALVGLYYGEKLLWEGFETSAGVLSLSRKYLFGGPKKEGGASGAAVFLPGDQYQVLPPDLTRRMGLTPKTCPAYRGITSVFMVSSSSWDGVYPDVDSEVQVPASGLTVTTEKKVGFTAVLTVADSAGRELPADETHTPKTADVPTAFFGLNHVGPPDVATPDGAAVLKLAHTYSPGADSPPTAILGPRRRTVEIVDGTGVVASDVEEDPGGSVHLQCLFDGATGEFKVWHSGTLLATEVLPAQSFILYPYLSNQVYGTATADITPDISDAVFPPDTVPLSDVV